MAKIINMPDREDARIQQMLVEETKTNTVADLLRALRSEGLKADAAVLEKIIIRLADREIHHPEAA